ncbi:MAG: hypothetical protein RLY93_19145 [Sumerlaeia bacterium]
MTRRSPAAWAEIAAGAAVLAGFAGAFGYLVLLSPAEGARSSRDAIETGMAAMANALENYHADHGFYPPGEIISPQGTYIYKLPPGVMDELPIDTSSYLDRLPIAYFTDGQRYVLHAQGPNGEYEVRADEWLGLGIEKLESDLPRAADVRYDPTNGLFSLGDYVFVGGGERLE